MAAAPKKEEEWEDVEGEEDEETEEEEEDTTINNSDVVMKYKKAATWANESITAVVAACKAGTTVGTLCKLGDDTVAAKVQQMFRGVDKGVAFPTCVSVNQLVCHNAPGPEDEAYKQVIQLGDVVRIDLGVHIDGYCAVVAHTVQVTANGELTADSKEANCINAAYAALNLAIRKMRPGKNVYDVTDVIEHVSTAMGVTPAEGVLSHQMKRYIIDGSRAVVNKNVPEHKVHNYDFEEASVWTLDVVMTTGKGKLKEREQRPYIYKIALDNNYSTKLQAAHDVQKEIDTKFQTFPFAMRQLEEKKARLGLSEMAKHGVIIPYPVLYERDGEAVAHFKVSLLITHSKIERITGIPIQKGPAVAAFTDPLLTETAKLSMTFAKKKAAEPAAASK